jgi:hypothetical protein
LRDLEIDIDKAIEGFDRLDLENSIMKPIRNTYLIFSALSWILTQSAVFLANFIQVEYGRRMLIRNANKRHAEVPPFPLI